MLRQMPRLVPLLALVLGLLFLSNSGADQNYISRHYGSYLPQIEGGNGGYWAHGVSVELLKINDSAYTETSGNLLPANSVIRAVTVRVTTVIPTAATFTVGDPTTAARFATGVSVAAGTTAVGLVHVDQTGASGPRQTSAAKVRITPNLTPATATGYVRIHVYYETYVAPTS